MSKFHINKHGVPAPCKATKGNCPLGGADGTENHFDSIEQAQEHVDKKNAQEYDFLPGLGTSATEREKPSIDLPSLDSVKQRVGNSINGPKESYFSKEGSIKTAENHVRKLDKLYEKNLNEANKPRRFPMSLFRFNVQKSNTSRTLS